MEEKLLTIKMEKVISEHVLGLLLGWLRGCSSPLVGDIAVGVHLLSLTQGGPASRTGSVLLQPRRQTRTVK